MPRKASAEGKKQVSVWISPEVYRRLAHYKVDSGSSSLDETLEKVLDAALPRYEPKALRTDQLPLPNPNPR